jgi:hypothetical protein
VSELVEVVHLRDFQRSLRLVSTAMPRELRQAGLRVAGLIVDDTQASLRSRPGVAPKVAPSVKALAQQRSASVRVGDTNTGHGSPLGPHAPEFGSNRFKQFQPHSGKEGYSLYPAIRKNQQRTIDAFGDELERLAAQAFPN